MQSTEQNSHDNTQHRTRIIAMVIYEGCQILDITGPLEVFSMATRHLKEQGNPNHPAYELHLVSYKKGPVTMSSGLQLLATHDFDSYPDTKIDTLMIAGGMTAKEISKEPTLTKWVINRAEKADRIASVCSGALILGEAGLLRNRKATTHWLDTEDLANISPSISVEGDSIYICDENIYTSAGVTSGMDLALSMVEEDYNSRLSIIIAKWLVLFIKRPGNQAQFSDILSHQSKAEKFAPLIDWMFQNLDKDLNVETLADKSAMSPRNFARRFGEELGLTPAKFIESLRLEKARRLLEDSSETIDKIGFDCGFKSSEHFRRAFERRLHTQPHSYRNRFQSAANS